MGTGHGDSNQGQKTGIIVPFLQPELGLEAWDLGSDWGSSFYLSVLTYCPIQKKALDYFTASDKVVMVILGRLLGLAAQLLPVLAEVVQLLGSFRS